MSWRTATTNPDISGSHLFQTAYTDASGEITSFLDGDFKVEKFVKNDYSDLVFKKTQMPFIYFVNTHSDQTDIWSSTDGKSFTTLTVSTSAGDFINTRNTAEAVAGYMDGTWVMNMYNESPVQGRIFKSNGLATGTLISSLNSNYYYSYPVGVAGGYFWIQGPGAVTRTLYRSADGQTWTACASNSFSHHSQWNMTYFDGKFVFPYANGVYVSSDLGATWTYYSMFQDLELDNSLEISYIEVRTVGGQERLYFHFTAQLLSNSQYQDRTAYITSIPTANDWIYTLVNSGTYLDPSAISYTVPGSVVRNGEYTFMLFQGSAGYMLTRFPDLTIIESDIAYSIAPFYNKNENKFYVTKYDGVTVAVEELPKTGTTLIDRTADFTLPASIGNEFNFWSK